MNLTMTHAQRKTAIRAEVAQELMGQLIAHYAEQIATEEAKPAPNVDAIARYEAEQIRIDAERAAVDVTNIAQIDRLIAKYKPTVMAAYAD